MVKKQWVIGLSSVLLFGINSVHAAPFTFQNIGDSVTINYSGNVDQNDVDGLSARTTYTWLGSDNGQYDFSVSIFNDADDDIWESARIAAVGFDTAPSISGGDADSDDWDVVFNSSFPNQFGSIDLCFKTNQTQNCSGGTGGGVELGQSVSFDFWLTFDGDVPPIEFSNFGLRWQSLTSLDGEFDGDSGTGSPTNGNGLVPPQEVPAPGVLGLFGLGLLGLGWVTLRRRSSH